MTLLFILVALIIAALTVVSFVNRAQKREQARRLQQRQLRLRIELLDEVVDCLLQTLPNRHIAKLINDEIIDLLRQVLDLEQRNSAHVEASLKNAETRGEELDNIKGRKRTSFLKESDAQIAQTQLHLNKATQVLRQQYSQGRIANEELDTYLSEITWAYLMISVVLFIGQGYKASTRGDPFSAQAFYKKAQHMLVESLHPDPRRMRLIKELGETIAGNRKTVSTDLVDIEISQ